MSNSPSRGTYDIPYKYIFVVLDVFIRFCFLHALETKSSTEVASRLIETLSDVVPPLWIQSDQGSEFEGSVKNLMQMKIIYSRPYHPQSQGKVRNNDIYRDNLM